MLVGYSEKSNKKNAQARRKDSKRSFHASQTAKGTHLRSSFTTARKFLLRRISNKQPYKLTF